MTNDFFWEIPSSIDLEEILKKHPPDFNNKIDHFYYIIDYLSRGMDLKDLDDNAGFINVNAQKLQRVIHNYKDYLDHLLKHRFIRTDMKYVVGKKSKGYQINNYKYYHATVKKIPVTSSVMKKHFAREQRERKNILLNTQKTHAHLTKWFNTFLVIDHKEALAKVEELYPEKTGPIRGTKKGKASDWEKRYKAVQAINKLANQAFYYSVDDNVGRFHSNLTNLKKEIRNYITYNGQKLVNVDIKNSQPLFSTLLFKKDFYNRKGLFNIFHIPFHSSILSNNIHSFTITTIMIVKALEKYGNQDIKIYLDMVNSGSFYKEISKLMYPNEVFNKEKVKPMIFTVFFSNNRYMGQPKAKAKRRFKEVLPYTYEVFRILKLCNHTALSRILQRIESIIMIHNVVPHIANEKPDLPIFTIHDSVVTTVGNEEYVAKVILEEIKRLTGLDAKVGMENWG